MNWIVMTSMATVLLGSAACAEPPPCDQLVKRLCDASSENCDKARGWLDGQGVGGVDAQAATCAAVIDDESAVATYAQRFILAMAPAPPVETTVMAAPTPKPASTPKPAPTPKPTVKDKVREVGDTAEEIGKTGEKVGEAIDKLGGALTPKPKPAD